jgi:hypothetical protein
LFTARSGEAPQAFGRAVAAACAAGVSWGWSSAASSRGLAVGSVAAS